jgi:hypothetical protein
MPMCQFSGVQTVDVVVSVLAGNVFSPQLPVAMYYMCFLFVPKRNLKTMLRYLYLFSLLYKLIRDVLQRI